MADPTTATATATLIGSAVAIPMLTLFGIPLGLRADELLAGFAGAVAAMALLDSVPSSGDTARELLRTTLHRVSVSVASSVTAGYSVPLAVTVLTVPPAAELALCFVIGGGAQRILRALIDRVANKTTGAPQT